jgi:hypothetical protein
MNIQCACGKRMGVSDAMAGKTVRCSGCGENVYVAASPASAKSAAARGKASEAPGLYISPGLIVGVSTLALVVIGAIAAYTGPYRVFQQWRDMAPQANGEITDVITFGLQAHLSETGDFNPRISHRAPAVEGPILFIAPVLQMSMPDTIPFHGMSNQGNFTGRYNPRTHEIRATIQFGGATVGGLIDTKRAAGDFDITGRDVNGFPQAEIDGRSLKIIYPPEKKLE